MIPRPRKTARKVRNRPEQQQQIALFRWAALAERDHPQLQWLFHCPNGGARSKVEASILKAMGVRRGVLDVWFPLAGAHSTRGLVFEFKEPGTAHRPSSYSDEQRAWVELLRGEGWAVHGIDDWEVAKRLLLEHLHAIPFYVEVPT